MYCTVVGLEFSDTSEALRCALMRDELNYFINQCSMSARMALQSWRDRK